MSPYRDQGNKFVCAGCGTERPQSEGVHSLDCPNCGEPMELRAVMVCERPRRRANQR